MHFAVPHNRGLLAGRRSFLAGSSFLLAGMGIALETDVWAKMARSEAEALRFGLVTDLHYADKPASNSRHYRESLQKLRKAAEQYESLKPQFMVCLGDIIDAADSAETEMGYLRRINREFSKISEDRHYVLGNHCVSTLSKEQFLGEVEREKSWYSFDRDHVHFVVLDACFTREMKSYGPGGAPWNDANLPAEQVEWLKGDLAATTKKTIVLAHQRLDVANNYGIKNGAAIRTIFEESKKVLAVFQGHSHNNEYTDINGIHYCTMQAMVEGGTAEDNGFSVVDVMPDGSIRIDGFMKQKDYDWKAGAS